MKALWVRVMLFIGTEFLGMDKWVWRRVGGHLPSSRNLWHEIYLSIFFHQNQGHQEEIPPLHSLSLKHVPVAGPIHHVENRFRAALVFLQHGKGLMVWGTQSMVPRMVSASGIPSTFIYNVCLSFLHHLIYSHSYLLKPNICQVGCIPLWQRLTCLLLLNERA